MSNLNLNNLRLHRDEILKAEIVSLFSLLEKTFTEWWKNKDFFHSYESSLNVNSEIENLLNKFKDINVKIKIKISSSSISEIDNCWENFINNNWRGWRRINLNSEPKKFLQVLYGSCERINSGIEKGSPSEENQVSEFSDKPFLSTSFGTFKNYIDNDKLNKLRNNLFSNINGLDNAIKNPIKNRKILEKSISELLAELSDSNTSILKLISLRIKIFNLVCLLYKNIPSDSRFPANDTSLFDQAYMSTSLFKAALAGLLLNSSDGIDINNFDGQKLKWSILGIQYDKLGLAEKGLKVASIEWYRDTSKEVDNAIKKTIEINYALGNEVYRDETGIYFVVPENIIEENDDEFYRLHNDLREIKEKIINIFSEKFEGEVFPAIFLTEPSRGLMNLGYLIEKAKENFLKAEVPDDFSTKITHDGQPNGICQICKIRLAHKGDKENLICDVCKKRQRKRIDKWLENIHSETIWITELQDKNGRIALVTLKFELEKWLNGDLLNSLVIQNLDLTEKKYLDYLNNIVDAIKTNKKINESLLKDYHANIPNLPFKNLIERWFLERSIGSKWERFILKKLDDWDDANKKPLKQKIDFENRKIYWNKLTDTDIELLSQLLLQFLLRKNPSPARLRRIWETTREFFEDLENEIMDIAEIAPERQKRLYWENVDIPDGEYQDGSIFFWAKNKTVYLITSIEKLGNKDKFSLKKYRDRNSGTTVTLDKQNAKDHDYKPYFTILSPTPVSWQFIIPAENVPTLIEKIQKKYYENFKWVYGKLPLHIGVVVQSYKKPLYIGIQALRKIRRDGVRWESLGKDLDVKSIKKQHEYMSNSVSESPHELTEGCEKFYSYLEKTSGEGKYEFYLYPDKDKKWLDIVQDSSNTDKFTFYSNTFDFEFLDTNTRRNDIYYKEDSKRLNRWKKLRPYDITEWQYFEGFKKYFFNEKSSSKLQKMISLIYSKLEDWNDDESIKQFMISAFINVLELKNEEERNKFAKVLGAENFNDLKRMEAKDFREKLYLLIDMFEFWHTMLKK